MLLARLGCYIAVFNLEKDSLFMRWSYCRGNYVMLTRSILDLASIKHSFKFIAMVDTPDGTQYGYAIFAPIGTRNVSKK